MKHLCQHYHPMALEELVAAANAGDLPTGAMAVTLDDGYLNNLTTVSPILSEFNIPATFFVTTDLIEEEHEFWWDILERVFISEHVLPSILDLYGNGSWTHRTETKDDKAAAHKALVETLYLLSSEEQQAILKGIAEWSGLDLTPRPTHRAMTSKELRLLSQAQGHSIGAHTAHHLSLPHQPLAVQRREVVDSKECLERILGSPVTTFSYPYGEVAKHTVEVVESASFEIAVTVEGRTVKSGANPLLVPRFEIKNCGVDEFARQIHEIFANKPDHA
jgi:peptidoglycan/xylan/chitin deacetylase (PgdA/CDA1 family)